jgi:DNA-binding CsgD family transcriptional regulator
MDSSPPIVHVAHAPALVPAIGEADMQLASAIRLAPATWLCVLGARPGEAQSINETDPVFEVQGHLQQRLRDLLDEIAESQCLSARLSSLTDRQREIAEMVALGASNKIIARHLGLSVGTVKVHLHRIFRVLGVNNRVQLAMMG